MNIKKILLGALVLALLGGIYGYYQYNRGVESLENKKADIAMTGADLLKAFETNEAEANKSYLDKVIEIKGKVVKFEKSSEKNSLYLETGNEMSSVICEMENSQKNDNIKEGDVVSIKGKCTGYLMDVVLVQCVLVN
jgi:hypothetical protein